jgi:hypothetical protein
VTIRLIFGLGWALTVGLAGGWLVLAPWAIGGQGAGTWSDVTRNEVGSGAVLIALAALAVLVIAIQSARSLRGVGAVQPTRPARSKRGAASSLEMEQALIALAQALADDLDAERRPARLP